jgi:hypothetical protein
VTWGLREEAASGEEEGGEGGGGGQGGGARNAPPRAMATATATAQQPHSPPGLPVAVAGRRLPAGLSRRGQPVFCSAGICAARAKYYPA